VREKEKNTAKYRQDKQSYKSQPNAQYVNIIYLTMLSFNNYDYVRT